MITGLYLILTPLFSSVFLKIKTRWCSIVGAVIAFGGLFLLTHYSWAGFNLGDALVLCCAICCAWHFIMTGQYTHTHDIISLTIFQLATMTLISGSVAVGRGALFFHVTPYLFWSLGFTAFLCTVFALLIQTAVQRVIDATRAGVIFSLEAVFGFLFACTLGHESPTPLSFVGAGLMILGMIVSESGLVEPSSHGGYPRGYS